LAKPS